MLRRFSYSAPAERSELLDLLAERAERGSANSATGAAKLLAGGTDLLVNIRAGVMQPDIVIDVKKVRGFSGISWSESEGLIIRPSVTINEVLREAAENLIRDAMGDGTGGDISEA